MTFGEKLVRLRREKGLSQEALAGELGVSRQAVSRWEMGAAMPDSPNLLKLSRMFGVSADYLLYDEYEEETHGQTATPAKKRDWGRLLAGGIALGVSALGLLALGILSSVFHVSVCESEPGVEWIRVYTGLWGFLKYHRLEWMFVLLIVTAAAGAAVLCFPWLKKRWSARKGKGEQ